MGGLTQQVWVTESDLQTLGMPVSPALCRRIADALTEAGYRARYTDQPLAPTALTLTGLLGVVEDINGAITRAAGDPTNPHANHRQYAAWAVGEGSGAAELVETIVHQAVIGGLQGARNQIVSGPATPAGRGLLRAIDARIRRAQVDLATADGQLRLAIAAAAPKQRGSRPPIWKRKRK